MHQSFKTNSKQERLPLQVMLHSVSCKRFPFVFLYNFNWIQNCLSFAQKFCFKRSSLCFSFCFSFNEFKTFDLAKCLPQQGCTASPYPLHVGFSTSLHLCSPSWRCSLHCVCPTTRHPLLYSSTRSKHITMYLVLFRSHKPWLACTQGADGWPARGGTPW